MEEILSKSSIGWRRAGISSVATTALVLGACVAGAGAASADADFEFERIAGDNRYETAADVFDAFGTSDSVILANGEQGHFPDALVANYLAGVQGSPILLTRADKMPDATAASLATADKSITIVGGTSVVSAEQESSLRADGHTVTRVAGDNRYTTAAAVIEAAGDAADATAIITTGVDFPDALSAGPLAYDSGMPLGITRADNINDAVVDALQESGASDFIVLGGPSIVSQAVIDEVEAAGLDFQERLFGDDRAETSVEVANYAIDNLDFSNEAVNVASGYIAGTGADALAGGPLTGMQVRPMLITRSNTNPGDSVLAFLAENCATLDEGIIFGGPAAVDNATEAEMEEAAQSCDGGTNPSNDTVTSRPELVNAQILETNASGPNAGTAIRYTFDENITGMNPVDDLFYAYFYDGTNATSADAIVDPNNSRAVIARFLTITSVSEAAAAGLTGAESLRLATVDFGAVADDTFSSTGAAAYNPIGDAQLAAGSESPGGSTGFQAGTTDGPDLVSVGNFRQVPGQNRTVVDFTFDEAATLVNPNATPAGEDDGFDLVLTDGVTDLVGDVQNGNGTTTIEVVFDSTGTGGLTAANVQRGTIDAGIVSDDPDDSTVDAAATPADPQQGNTNPLQAVDIAASSASPDLVSATLGNFADEDAAGDDYIDYKFDEAVTALVVGVNFMAYDANGEEIASGVAQRSTADNTVVRVTYTDEALLSAVGASVVDSAVNADDGAPTQNQQDEVGVANSNTDTTAGSSTVRTEGPDLTGVVVNEDTDVFGTPLGTFAATYSFDDKLAGTITPNGDGFQLVLANGDIIDAFSCTVDEVATTVPPGTTTTNTVTCDAFASTPGQPGQAVLGTVDNDNVNDVDGGQGNPEGAAEVS